MRIEIGDRIIEYGVQYGKRKKLLINIDEIGFITIKAPNNASEGDIINFIRQNGKWIKEKLDEISEFRKIPIIKVYDGEGKFFHLGKQFCLHELIETSELGKEELKTKLKKFYISSCKKIIEERIKVYQQQLGVKPKTVEVVESKRQWGSCNSDKRITFNYRLAMAPLEVIDYVIVHELCHLIHMNHDRSFWRLVGSVLRDYKKREEFLAIHGSHMML